MFWLLYLAVAFVPSFLVVRFIGRVNDSLSIAWWFGGAFNSFLIMCGFAVLFLFDETGYEGGLQSVGLTFLAVGTSVVTTTASCAVISTLTPEDPLGSKGGPATTTWD